FSFSRKKLAGIHSNGSLERSAWVQSAKYSLARIRGCRGCSSPAVSSCRFSLAHGRINIHSDSPPTAALDESLHTAHTGVDCLFHHWFGTRRYRAQTDD